MLGDSHEYKVMGLAPYYDGFRYKEVEKVFHKMQKVKGTELVFNKKIKNIFYYLEKELFNYRFDYIATALQSFTEKILVKWFQNILNKYGGSHITFSGGQSMNVKANYQISKLKNKKCMYVDRALTTLFPLVHVTTMHQRIMKNSPTREYVSWNTR